MINYALKCGQGHGFDSWFQSAAAFDRLEAAGMLACAVCGSADVVKGLMAPRVVTAENAALVPTETPARQLALPTSELEKQIAELRKKVEENSTYVGGGFVAEARAIHEGTAPERSIWGEARPEEARALMEEGVPVAPLPFMPSRKAN
jgi:hypothetical protein